MQPPTKEAPLFRQGVIGRRGDFRQRQPGMLPSEKMTTGGDLDGRSVAAPLNFRETVRLEQLRVQCPSKQVEVEFRDFRSYGKHCTNPRYDDHTRGVFVSSGRL